MINYKFNIEQLKCVLSCMIIDILWIRTGGKLYNKSLKQSYKTNKVFYAL